MKFPKATFALLLIAFTTTGFAKTSESQKEIVVAVIDTGADTLHPVLKDNLWTNPGETGLDASGRDKSTNGVDDDGNGYIDDVHGWNFAGDSNNLADLHGHGTHVAGIIHSVSPKTNLMILKYYDPDASGEDNLNNTVKAIRYAIQMKAQIINYSGGGTTKYPAEELAIREAQRQGILIAAAAGNERSNSDVYGFYPADYGLSNIISVTAIDESRRVLASSNYGTHTVDIAAPGHNVTSTLPGGKFGTMTGTSQATAYVSGAAALLMAETPGLIRSPELLIQQLTQTGDEDLFLIGKTKHETALNTQRSLQMKGAGLGAFGAGVLTSSTDYDFSSKLDPDFEDPGAEELPFKTVSMTSKMP